MCCIVACRLDVPRASILLIETHRANGHRCARSPSTRACCSPRPSTHIARSTLPRVVSQTPGGHSAMSTAGSGCVRRSFSQAATAGLGRWLTTGVGDGGGRSSARSVVAAAARAVAYGWRPWLEWWRRLGRSSLHMILEWTRACSGPVASFPARFSMPTTTTRILAMSTVLKTRAVDLYLVYVTVFRYILTPRRRALEGANP